MADLEKKKLSAFAQTDEEEKYLQAVTYVLQCVAIYGKSQENPKAKSGIID